MPKPNHYPPHPLRVPFSWLLWMSLCMCVYVCDVHIKYHMPISKCHVLVLAIYYILYKWIIQYIIFVVSGFFHSTVYFHVSLYVFLLWGSCCWCFVCFHFIAVRCFNRWIYHVIYPYLLLMFLLIELFPAWGYYK